MSSTVPARTSLNSSRGRALRGAAAAIIGLGMLLTSACGSDDSDDSASAAEDSSQEESDGAQDDAGSEQAEDAEDAEDAADDGGSDSEYCGLLEQMGTDFLNSMDAAPGEGGDDQLAGMLSDVAAAAPAEVAEDWQTLADMYDVMANIDLTDPDAVAELDALGDIEGAGERIQQHVQDECA